MSKTEPRWIRTDPASDLLNSLEHCLLTFKLALGDERNWKWCVAAAHSAAQTAMVYKLDKAGENEHFEPKSRKNLIAYFNESGENSKKKYPNHIRLAAFMDLYKSCKKHLLDETVASELYRDLERLNWLRNHWTHFGRYSGSSIVVEQARKSTLAGIMLVYNLHLPAPEYQYDSEIDAVQYEIAISSLLRLLSVAEIDTTQLSKAKADILVAAAKLAALDEDGDRDKDGEIGK